MKDSAIILDLDDTLIATHYRQYRCINDYLQGKGISFVGFEEYFHLRRTHHLSNSSLLKYLHINPHWEKFNSYYQQNIESKNYLAADTLIADRQLLAQVKEKKHALILLSLRSNPANSLHQLQQLGLATYFDEIHFVQHQLSANSKIPLLRLLSQSHDIIAFCGDSLSDYEAAVQLNINFVQVKTSLYDLPGFEKSIQFTDINQYFLSIL